MNQTIRQSLFALRKDTAPAAANERADRVRSVARVRWLLLILIGSYAVCAGSVYTVSAFGFFLTSGQLLTLLVSLVAVVTYNALSYWSPHRLLRLPASEEVLVLLDLLFVTILIHISGGGASWFWPVYLVVTLEAAFLLDNFRRVALLGGCGGALYGSLLLAEYLDWAPAVTMPFVANELHHDSLHLLLIWLWVSLLNSAVAVIGTFLIGSVRSEKLAAQHAEEQLVDFLHRANDLVFSFNRAGHLLFVNQAWQRTLGYTAEQQRERTVLDLIAPENHGKCLLEFRKALAGDRAAAIDGDLLAADGRRVAVEGHITSSRSEDGSAVTWAIFRDVTDRKHAQEQLYHMAHHDTLTSLPNRLFFLDALKQARAVARRHNNQLAVLFLDLDRFKLINDTLGHAAGDQLLQEVARRLSSCVREADTVARLGGDEFTVILTGLHDIDDAKLVARKILKALIPPVIIDNRELFITTSIGISLFPKDGDSPAEMLKKADIAMYHAKTLGRNMYQFYEPEMDQDTDRRLAMESRLRRAVERGEFLLAYQPKIDIASGAITSLEALLRWQHPELGLLAPGEFISLAEETGLILPIGEWVLREACRQNRQWQDAGLPAVRVAVNLSGYQLQQRQLLPSLRRILAESGLDPRWLELEITETVIMQNPDFAESILAELSALGVHISIDDFGTGYSSLAHLKRFTINTLKIDKSFVRDVETSTTDAAIASAIIAMGSSLNLRVIAEGVETAGQLSFLKERSCDEVQGFLFSRPVSPGEIERLLREGARQGEASP